MINDSSIIKCHRPWTGFEIVDHIGDVRPCCWGKTTCGNVNDSSPEEIWAGEGYQYYRMKMLAGETDAICADHCPILNGHYDESSKPLSTLSVTHSPPPQYLRVVPTTRCNLRCPMCYQQDSPAPRLPASLFESLRPWLSTAIEFQILGGEPFLAPECLDWIKRITPADFPTLRLSAITNGLGFSKATCGLVRERRWSWILVSIDAASPGTFARVRGGDFNALMLGLDRLAELRSQTIDPFEIRFGFTLQRSNLHEVDRFIDLCADYRAVPQFTLVFGDWHSESPESSSELNEFYGALEVIDKRLAEDGFSNRSIAGPIAALRQRRQRLPGSATSRVPMPVPLSVWHPVDHASYEATTLLSLNDHGDVVVTPFSDASSSDRVPHLTIRLTSSLAKQIDRVEPVLAGVNPTSFSVAIPYMDCGNAISALKMRSHVNRLSAMGKARGWQFTGGDPSPLELGLHPADDAVIFEIIEERRARPTPVSISVVSPMNNCSAFLPDFLNSLQSQAAGGVIEFVLVDDQSSDDSFSCAQSLLNRYFPRGQWSLLKTKRRRRYERGTFSFGAGLAREIGARRAVGHRLLFIDPDQTVQDGCVQEHIDWGARGFDVVIGDRVTTSGDSGTAWARLRQESLDRNGHWWLSFFTGNSSVDRTVFEKAGGFDPSLQYWGLDDTDLAYRLFRHGATVWHTTRACVQHQNQSHSGGGETEAERMRSFRLHMEVLYRKYLQDDILDAFAFVRPREMAIEG